MKYDSKQIFSSMCSLDSVMLFLHLSRNSEQKSNGKEMSDNEAKCFFKVSNEENCLQVMQKSP